MRLKSKIIKAFANPRLIFKILNPEVLWDRLIGIDSNHKYSFLFAKKTLKRNIKTLIDVGTNRGDFVKAGRYLFSNLRVYAFEPVPNIFHEKNVNFYNLGLSNKREKKLFYINKIDNMWSTFHKPLEKHSSDFSAIENFKKAEINLDRFDNLNIIIERPCFLKIDTEGHEYEVLDGFGDRLKEIDIIQVEHIFRNYFSEKRKLSDIIALLEKYKFNGMIQFNLRYTSNKLSFCDFLFYRIKD